MNIVVTGGAGFIGSHLVDALLAQGHKVFALDNLISGKEENLLQAKKNANFTFLNFDVINELPTLEHIDYLCHLASPASVPDYQKYPEETALVNSVGTRGLLKIAKTYNTKFLFTSTSEVYGDPKEHPQKEMYWGNVNPIGVRACYDESKRYGEMITMLYHRKFGLDTRIIRIFNTYGPRMRPDDGRVISNLINQAIAGQPLTIHGDGTQTRSFCYITDMVEGLLQAMFSDGIKGEVINLGNPEEYRILDLADKIKALTGTQAEIIYQDLPQDDPVRRCPEISKAIKLLNWKPKVSLDQGLTKTIEYYQSLK